MKRIIIITAAIKIIICLILLITPAQSREIRDMKGNIVSVPDNIKKVYAGSPPMTYIIYAVKPELLSGLNFPVADIDKPYLHKTMQTLPVLGGFFGQGNAANPEMILKAKPDLIILWTQKTSWLRNQSEELMMGNVPIPHVYVYFESLYDYENAFLFLGKLFGMESRTQILGKYAGDTVIFINKIVASIPAEERLTVYYAEGIDGLNTDCDGSWHTELINIAGAKNVYRRKGIDSFGMERISMEQVMIYNPDVILVQERYFYGKIFTDPLWKDLKAVKTKRVYLIPRIPFNWFDRPPSFMRLIGIKWLMHNLYPDQYKINIVKEAREFYKLFLGVNKTEQDIKGIIYP